MYVIDNGIKWRNLPNCFPKWEAVYYYIRKWTKIGILDYVLEEVNKIARKRELKYYKAKNRNYR